LEEQAGTVVRLCGPLVVEIGGRRLEAAFPSRQGRLVFAYLVLNRGRAVSRDELIEALWPERIPPSPERLLTQLLSRLRRALPAGTLEGRSQLALDLGPHAWIDIEAATAASTRAREALAAGTAVTALDEARDGLRLLTAPLLPDFDRPWLDDARRAVGDLRTQLLETLARAGLQTKGDDLVDALAAARELIEREPFRESAYALLMEAHAARGDVAEAVRVFDRMRTLLREELGTVPGAAVRALADRLLKDHRAPADALPLGDESLSVGHGDDVGGSERALRSLTLVPALSVPLLGREQDVRALAALLREPGVRLVTVTGPGGVGKTSMAIETVHRIASEFADGAVYVELESVTDAGTVAETVLRVLGGAGEVGLAPVQSLGLLLASREQLLVLDNFEQLLPAAPLLGELLALAPRLRLLVTSRAALDLRAEQRYRLEPLRLPTAGAQATTSEIAEAPATALFVRRARARDPSFRLDTENAPAIAAICSRLDGLPLAIDLAAAHCTALGPSTIARRLARILPSLAPGARDSPERQRTLRATLDWSHALLGDSARAAFARLAVFTGGCSAEAAVRVTRVGADDIRELLAHSLLSRRPGPDGDTRLVMLQPVREYAAELLARRSDAHEIADRHSRYFLELADTAGARLRGADQLVWRKRLDADADNLRAALERDTRSGKPERALRLATALEFWWHDRVLWAEGRRRLETALAAAPRDLPIPVRAAALRVVALLSGRQTDFEHSLASGRQALDLHRAAGERTSAARCAAVLAFVQRRLGDHAAADAAAAQALDLVPDTDEWTQAVALAAQADGTGDAAEAVALTRRAAELFRRTGDQWGLAWMLRNLGSAAFAHGDLDDARRGFEQALELTEHIDDPLQSIVALGHLARVALAAGDETSAAARYREVLARCRHHGLRRPALEPLTGLAEIAARAGDDRGAAELATAAAALRSAGPASGPAHLHTTADIRPAAFDRVPRDESDAEATRQDARGQGTWPG
jgi:pentatricopeptide repeat protein